MRYKKGELKYYQTLNPVELNDHLDKFPINTEHIKYFYEKHKYDWVKKKWFRGKTISTERY